MQIKRHNLVKISNNGRMTAFAYLKKSVEFNNIDRVRKLVVEGYEGVKIPGIMRRAEETGPDGMVAVGFTSPYRGSNGRLRIPAFVPEDEITEVITPYEVLKTEFIKRTRCLQALEQVLAAAESAQVKLGIWGSGAMEVSTELTYTDDNSDLDLLVCPSDIYKLQVFYHTIWEIGQKYRCNIDLELDLPTGYGVKVPELFMDCDDVLGKSLTDVQLIPKYLIKDMLKKY